MAVEALTPKMMGIKFPLDFEPKRMDLWETFAKAWAEASCDYVLSYKAQWVPTYDTKEVGFVSVSWEGIPRQPESEAEATHVSVGDTWKVPDGS